MIKVEKIGIILSKTRLKFENQAVLNPAIIRVDDNVHIYYRAVQKGNFSTIGYCRLDGPLNIAERWNRPIINREHDFESQGVEDPRIVNIDAQYYMTYTGYDGINARGALAISKDLFSFEKKGLIVPPISYTEFVSMTKNSQNVNESYFNNNDFYERGENQNIDIKLWDKNVVFFPRKIKGNFVFMHRIRPGIQVVSVKDFESLTLAFWKKYFANFQDNIVFDPIYPHESCYIGCGCPPIETEHGWLLIYHGVEKKEKGLVYSACAALLDLNDPSIELARLPYALFKPEYEWEIHGDVDFVVFPTGTALFGDTLFIYYGAADSHIACASLNLNALINELLMYLKKEKK